MATRLLRPIVLFFLTVVPAYALRLPTTVIPVHYDLAFRVDLAGARFDGTETIRVQVGEATSTIVLHAKELRFTDVSVGAGAAAQRATVTEDEANETATFTVARPLPRGETEIHVRFGGVLNDKLRGFYLSHGAGRTYAATQFESTDARRAFPCFDEPALKATFAIALTIDRGDTAISNGRVIADTPGPSATQHTLTFSTSPRMSSYLVAMAVGDFQCTAGSADSVPIRICATPDKKHLTRIALESAEYILAFYNRYYAIKYPFGKLDVVGIPDFAAGAMENTAAIFYREADLLANAADASVATRKNIASVLAHEMAHQWFGDLVTMQWWDDIWLNEGFATWMANRPLDAWKPEWNIPVDEELEKQRALALDSLESTRPVHAAVDTPAEIDAVFDPIAYEKGAAVLRMIEGHVGRDTFRRGVNAYLQAHAYQNAKSGDFWAAMAAASGKPVDRILKTFVNQPGAPLVDVSLACTGGQTIVTLAQRRFFVDAGELARSSSSLWQIPLCLKAGGASNVTCDVLADAKRSMPIAGACAGWVFANAGAHGYYRTAYPPDMLRAIAPEVETSLTAPERLSLIEDEWALVRAGRHSAADYLTLAAGAALDPTLAAPIVRIAAEHGDSILYDKLTAAAEKAVSPEERYRYLHAASSFRDPAVIDRALGRVLSPDIRNQDASLYLSRFFGNPAARPLAWQFLKERWTEIEPKMTIGGGGARLVTALGSFCDARARDDVKAFFAAHPVRSGTRALGLTLERISNCIELRDKQTGVVAEWLKNR